MKKTKNIPALYIESTGQLLETDDIQTMYDEIMNPNRKRLSADFDEEEKKQTIEKKELVMTPLPKSWQPIFDEESKLVTNHSITCFKCKKCNAVIACLQKYPV